MDRIANPFAPGVGVPPPELAGRAAIVEDGIVSIERNKRGLHAKPLVVSGLRGVGKTVLLHTFRVYCEDQHYGAAFIEATEQGGFLRSLAQELRSSLAVLRRASLSDLGRRALATLKSFSLGVGGEPNIDDGVNLDEIDYQDANTGDTAIDLQRVLVAIGEAVGERGSVLCIGIDDVQDLSKDELRGLISTLQAIAARKLPIAIVGAGLPNLQNSIADAKPYAERQFHFVDIGSLSVDDVRRAVETPIVRSGASISDDAIAKIAAVTQGYPYFVQEWARDTWNVARGNTIIEEDVDAATPVALQRLDRDFFQARLSRLTQREIDYAFALATLGAGPQGTEDVASKFGTTSAACASLRERLIQKGEIFSPKTGATQFTAPLFDDYLLRTQQPAQR